MPIFDQANVSKTRGGIFLSHSHTDKNFARRLAVDLMAVGVPVWVDHAEIKVGDSLLEKISDGIQTMEYLAVILSSSSVGSGWVRRELEVAMNAEIKGRRVKVLPLLLEDCIVPMFLQGKFCADFRDPSRYEESLQLVLTRVSGSMRPLELNAGQAAKSILRLAALEWSQRHLLISHSKLRTLADEKVEIPPSAIDLVVESVIELGVHAYSDWLDWCDRMQSADDVYIPYPDAERLETAEQSILWAGCCGLGERINDVFRALEERVGLYSSRDVDNLRSLIKNRIHQKPETREL